MSSSKEIHNESFPTVKHSVDDGFYLDNGEIMDEWKIKRVLSNDGYSFGNYSPNKITIYYIGISFGCIIGNLANELGKRNDGFNYQVWKRRFNLDCKCHDELGNIKHKMDCKHYWANHLHYLNGSTVLFQD